MSKSACGHPKSKPSFLEISTWWKFCGKTLTSKSDKSLALKRGQLKILGECLFLICITVNWWDVSKSVKRTKAQDFISCTHWCQPSFISRSLDETTPLHWNGSLQFKLHPLLRQSSLFKSLCGLIVVDNTRPPLTLWKVNLLLQLSTNIITNLTFLRARLWLNHHKWVLLQTGAALMLINALVDGGTPLQDHWKRFRTAGPDPCSPIPAPPFSCICAHLFCAAKRSGAETRAKRQKTMPSLGTTSLITLLEVFRANRCSWKKVQPISKRWGFLSVFRQRRSISVFLSSKGWAFESDLGNPNPNCCP